MFVSMKYPTIWKVAALVVSHACLTPALAAPVKTSGNASYTVKSGDTFAKIARQHGISLGELLKANKLSNPDRIVLGQRISIPGTRAAAPRQQSTPATASRPATPVTKPGNPRSTTVDITPPAPQGAYIVKSGDTLSKIQRQTGVPVSQLLKLNGLADSSTIRPGQTLRLNATAKVNPSRALPPAPAAQQDTRPALSPAVIADTDIPAPRTPQTPLMQPSVSGTAPHKVESGETFSSISRQYGIQTTALIAANRSINPNKLKVGQTLLIPGQPIRPQTRELAVNVNGRQLAEQPDPLARDNGGEEVSTLNHTRTGYLVQSGESIEEIADRFACSPQDIRRLNRMSSADQIYPGRYILVPFNREAPRHNRYAKHTL